MESGHTHPFNYFTLNLRATEQTLNYSGPIGPKNLRGSNKAGWDKASEKLMYIFIIKTSQKKTEELNF